jgi:hypothetical protein
MREGDYVLAVDSSTILGWVSLGIVDSQGAVKILSAQKVNTYSHSEGLLESIHHSLDVNGLTHKDVTYYVLGVGPGSFTGLRIGASLLSGLASASLKGCFIGISSHVGVICAYLLHAKDTSGMVGALYSQNNDIFSADEVLLTGFQASMRGGDCILDEKIINLPWPCREIDFSTIDFLATESVSKNDEGRSVRRVGKEDRLILAFASSNIDKISSSAGTNSVGDVHISTKALPVDELPISTGLIYALFARDSTGRLNNFQDRIATVENLVGDGFCPINAYDRHLDSRSYISNARKGINLFYGQLVKAKTLKERRGS